MEPPPGSGVRRGEWTAARERGGLPGGTADFGADAGSDELAAVTLTEPFEVARFAAVPGEPNPADPRFEPYAVALSPADGTLWVSGLDGVLRIFDPATETWDETRGPVFMNGGAPFFLDFDSTGSTLLVPVQNINGSVTRKRIRARRSPA